MLRYGPPHLDRYVTHADRAYVGPWLNQNRGQLLGLGQVTEQPELRTFPWQIDVDIALDPRQTRAEKWAGAATVVGVLAGLASVAAIMGWIR